MIRHISACLVSLAVTAGMATAQTAGDLPGSAFSVGLWNGAATADAQGKFTNCYVTLTYSRGEVAWFALYPNDVIGILVSDPLVPQTAGTTFENVMLMTEVGAPMSGEGYTADARFAGINFQGIDPMIAFLAQGTYMRLLGIGINQSFDVRGLGAALSRARECLNDNGGIQAAAPAGASAAGGQPESGTAQGQSGGASTAGRPKPTP
jgi:hypothetical protein